MNTATLIVAALVIGPGIYFLFKAFGCGSRGECTSCTSCHFAEKCSDESSKGIKLKEADK